MNQKMDEALSLLDAQKHRWAVTPVGERIVYLAHMRAAIMAQARNWVDISLETKGRTGNAAYASEEWMSGPYSLMAYINGLLTTLIGLPVTKPKDRPVYRILPTGQTALQIMPSGIYDKVLQPGGRAEIWMQPGVSPEKAEALRAQSYRKAPPNGKVALVLGAGNVSAISPIDCLHKLMVDNQVVLLKLNPVNAALMPVFEAVLAPFIGKGFVRIVNGDATVGDYLCNHAQVQTIHITGSVRAHDAIVWGAGADAQANKRQNTPRNRRPITSELGGITPAIIVPGPWSKSDIAFQAEHIASQKLNNGGANCVATQVLIVSEDWAQKDAFLKAAGDFLKAAETSASWYPGAEDRLVSVGGAGLVPFVTGSGAPIETDEVFAATLGVTRLKGQAPEDFLRDAIAYANTQLPGTLGANIIIHPDTLKALGRERFDALISELRYGCIAVNSWCGTAFSLAKARWGAFPGHSPEDVESGIGWVHNTGLYEKTERTVIEAPFRPRRKPVWFVTAKNSEKVAEALLKLQYKPGVKTLWAVLRAAG